MPTVNEQLLESSISHQIDIEHYSNGVVRRIIALLNRVDSDLFAQLQSVLDDMEGQTFTVQRLEKLLESVRALNAQAYESIGKELAGELKSLTEYEVGYQHQLFSSMLPVQVSIASVPPKQVYAAAMARPFQGRLLREWLDGLEESRAAKVRDAIRIGYVEGETNQQIITRIRGTKALNYADGLLDISRRDAEAIVRTSVAHTANYSRQHFMEANTDIIKGVKWIATLDSRTTPVCRAHDGKIYPVDSGPRPPAHIRCRSSISPVTKSWKELGIDLPEKDVGTRASMDGQVPGDMNYAEWLAKKPAAFQDEVLGATRGRLFRDGKMPLTSFVNNAGREYTLTIHVPGEADERITVEFRHKTRDQLKALLDDMREGKATDEQVLGDVVAGWSDVDEKFTQDALKQLCQNYASAAGSFIDAYIQGITKGRAGN